MAGGTDVISNSGQVRILAIIVVYRMSPLLTSSFVTLQKARDAVPARRLELRTLLYDNSSDAQAPESLPPGVEYHWAGENKGLSSAYNGAARLAAANGYDWLLTLDQDTALPADFLLRITEIAASVASDPAIAAIVPLITDGGRIVSPNWFFMGALPRWYEKGKAGPAKYPTYAFNSASTLKVASIFEAGGYNPWFWLDYSDGYIFRQFERHRRRVYVAGDVEVAHDFSLMDMENRVPLNRYENMRLAESAFWDLEMNRLAGMERTYGLVRLALKHLLQGEAPEHRAMTWEFLKRRLFWSRKKRLDAWKQETLRKFPGLADKRAPPYL